MTTRAGQALNEPEGFAYHAPDCAITAEDNCTCDLPKRVAAIEKEVRDEIRARVDAQIGAIDSTLTPDEYNRGFRDGLDRLAAISDDTTPQSETQDGERLDHGYSPRPEWAGTCPRCGAAAGTNCAVISDDRDREVERLIFKAEEYIEAVVTYLDPGNQFTHSRRRHVDRTGEELAEIVAGLRASGGD